MLEDVGEQFQTLADEMIHRWDVVCGGTNWRISRAGAERLAC
jgi:hypothetical protein